MKVESWGLRARGVKVRAINIKVRTRRPNSRGDQEVLVT